MMKTVEHPRIPLRSAEVWPLSVAAYRALGEAGLIPKNTELLYGFVYTKMSKSPLHSALVRQLIRLLEQATLSDCFISSEQPITCEDSEPEPDVAVVRGRPEDFWHEHPRTAELVIEVCVTSHDYDRSKLRAYASAGVKECWLVLGPEKQIEVHRQPAEGDYVEHTLHGPGGQLNCAALPGFTVDMEALFVK
ncbi:MAG: Uma2 family endonuclease [Verrucomicrobiae bacterium]|nr:Uma2 family endonuclease [Verrucomicrobiae bacterium]